MNKRFSLHSIESAEACTFSEAAYSRFKFGDTAVAEQFGKELFAGFIAQHSDFILAQDEIVLLPSPYYAIPTASDYLCHYFKKELNYFLFSARPQILRNSQNTPQSNLRAGLWQYELRTTRKPHCQ